MPSPNFTGRYAILQNKPIICNCFNLHDPVFNLFCKFKSFLQLKTWNVQQSELWTIAISNSLMNKTLLTWRDLRSYIKISRLVLCVQCFHVERRNSSEKTNLQHLSAFSHLASASWFYRKVRTTEMSKCRFSGLFHYSAMEDIRLESQLDKSVHCNRAPGEGKE